MILLGGVLIAMGAGAYLFGTGEIEAKGIIVGFCGLGIVFFSWLLGE